MLWINDTYRVEGQRIIIPQQVLHTIVKKTNPMEVEVWEVQPGAYPVAEFFYGELAPHRFTAKLLVEAKAVSMNRPFNIEEVASLEITIHAENYQDAHERFMKGIHDLLGKPERSSFYNLKQSRINQSNPNQSNPNQES